MSNKQSKANNVDNSKSSRMQWRPSKPYGHRILRVFIRNGRELQFHATKGWRSYRVVK